MHAAHKFVVGETYHRDEPFAPWDWLRPVRLRTSIARQASIDSWLPVSDQLLPIRGYVSWLAILKKGAKPTIVIDKDIHAEILREAANDDKRAKRAQAKFFAIIAHEVGHELMRDTKRPRKYVTQHGGIAFAGAENPFSEAEAWLFACFLRGFVLGAIAGAERPDRATDYA